MSTMSDDVKPCNLTEILARAQAATPGPWATHLAAPKWDTPNQCGYDSREHHRGPAYYATGPRTETVEQAEVDSFFIAHAREDVPAMVAEIERWREAARHALRRVDEDDPHYVTEAVEAMIALLPPT
jgi:hypothetical protein